MAQPYVDYVINARKAALKLGRVLDLEHPDDTHKIPLYKRTTGRASKK
jgi:hypothetical protein